MFIKVQWIWVKLAACMYQPSLEDTQHFIQTLWAQWPPNAQSVSEGQDKLEWLKFIMVSFWDFLSPAPDRHQAWQNEKNCAMFRLTWFSGCGTGSPPGLDSAEATRTPVWRGGGHWFPSPKKRSMTIIYRSRLSKGKIITSYSNVPKKRLLLSSTSSDLIIHVLHSS